VDLEEVTSFSRDSVLLARAREFLAAGPAEPAPLIAYVCQLPKPPMAVAEHMAVALFERVRDIAREPDGRWTLAGRIVAASPAVAPLVPAAAPGTTSPSLAQLTYAVVDVETTGTSAMRGDRITEVAAVIVKDGAVAEIWETLVNPERSIPPWITALTRITWGMVKDKPTFREIAPELARVLERRLFVAHNAAFDWRFVSTEMHRATGERLVGERLCTVRLARAVLPQVRRRSLDSLQHYFGVENTARHRAGGDALATARILIRLLGEAQSCGCLTLEDVRTLTRPAPRKRRSRRRPRTPQWGDGDHAA
jgi:DNA polymerase-3 subunit epsilon